MRNFDTLEKSSVLRTFLRGGGSDSTDAMRFVKSTGREKERERVGDRLVILALFFSLLLFLHHSLNGFHVSSFRVNNNATRERKSRHQKTKTKKEREKMCWGCVFYIPVLCLTKGVTPPPKQSGEQQEKGKARAHLYLPVSPPRYG